MEEIGGYTMKSLKWPFVLRSTMDKNIFACQAQERIAADMRFLAYRNSIVDQMRFLRVEVRRLNDALAGRINGKKISKLKVVR